MPKPAGERIATLERFQTDLNGEGLEFGYSEHGELYITSDGVVERHALAYHPAGAPNYPAILDDHTRPVDRTELDGLRLRYKLSDEQFARINTALQSPKAGSPGFFYNLFKGFTAKRDMFSRN